MHTPETNQRPEWPLEISQSCCFRSDAAVCDFSLLFQNWMNYSHYNLFQGCSGTPHQPQTWELLVAFVPYIYHKKSVATGVASEIIWSCLVLLPIRPRSVFFPSLLLPSAPLVGVCGWCWLFWLKVMPSPHLPQLHGRGLNPEILEALSNPTFPMIGEGCWTPSDSGQKGLMV